MSTRRKHAVKKQYFQYPNVEKPYTYFTDASHYAYSGVLTQAAASPEDLRPIACTSGPFSNTQQRWSATEKEAFAVYQSVLKFYIYLREPECILCCNHEPLEPFYLRVLKYLSMIGSLWNLKTTT